MQVKFTRLFAGAAVALGLAFAAPSTASAQMGFLVEANYGADTEFGAGAGVTFGLGSLTTNSGIRGEATFDYYVPGGGSDFGGFSADWNYWEINGNALMDIKSVPGLYVGAGVNYANTSWDFEGCGVFCELAEDSASDIGLNILGGWNFSGSKGPFAQAKFVIGGGEQLVVTGGIRF